MTNSDRVAKAAAKAAQLNAKVNNLRQSLGAAKLQTTRAKALMQQARKSKPITDGYVNQVEHLGYRGSRRANADEFQFDRLSLDWLKLDRMYRGSWVVGLLVDSVAEDMTQYGITLTGNLDPHSQQKIQRSLTKLGIWDSLTALIKKSRLYGGAIAYIDIAGADWESPLDLSTIDKGSFRGLKVYERWFVQPTMDDIVQHGRDAGLPRYYRLMSPTSQESGGYFPAGDVDGMYADPSKYMQATDIRLHHTRVIRSVGIELPFIQRLAEQYWGESILERLQGEINSVHRAYASYSALLSYMSIRVFKLDGLNATLSGDNPRMALERRMEALNEYQTSQNATILSVNDDFQMHQTAFTGMREALIPCIQPLAAMTGIPLVRFLGEPPKGMNATGDSDKQNYQESIRRKQEMMRDSLCNLLNVVHCSELDEEPDEDFNFEFVPLIQESYKDKAEVAYGVTKTVALALEQGIITPYIAAQELSESSQKTEIFKNVDTEYLQELKEQQSAPAFGEDPWLSGNEVPRGTSEQGEAEQFPHPAPAMSTPPISPFAK